MTKTALKEMLLSQYELNEKTNGPDWVYGITKEGRIINWPRAIFLETAELIESYPWKHWKNINGTVDIENAKIELSDIWHFIMSYGISVLFIEKRNEVSSRKDLNSKDFFIENVIDDLVELFFLLFSIKFEKATELNEILYNYEFMSFHANTASLREFDLNKEFSSTTSIKKNLLVLITRCFITSLQSIDMDLEKIYIGKNVLNKFRQDHGYKDGTYKKQWLFNGKEVEDNVVMTTLIDIVETKDLYSALESAYK